MLKHDMTPRVSGYSLKKLFENTQIDCLTYKNKLTHGYGHYLNLIDE